jgi:phosphatidate cytidylyltransferase
MRLLLIYLGILLLGVLLYTSFKKTADKRSLYFKFLSFAAVALFTYFILDQRAEYTPALYSVIAALALYEVIRVTRSLSNAYLYIVISLVLLGLFVYTSVVPAFPHSALFLCVLSFDAFSQFFGQIFGRHALTRKISPNKTIEGCAGGLLLCLLTSFCVFGSAWKGLPLAFFALSGDLLASLVKRRAGVKDFSRLLPGQGGILDRFDSYILSAICYLLFL